MSLKGVFVHRIRTGPWDIALSKPADIPGSESPVQMLWENCFKRLEKKPRGRPKTSKPWSNFLHFCSQFSALEPGVRISLNTVNRHKVKALPSSTLLINPMPLSVATEIMTAIMKVEAKDRRKTGFDPLTGPL